MAVALVRYLGGFLSPSIRGVAISNFSVFDLQKEAITFARSEYGARWINKCEALYR